jgi:hypothetical protein
MRNGFADASFGEEVGGYAPGEVDNALAAWAASPPDAVELRNARFARAIRGYVEVT